MKKIKLENTKKALEHFDSVDSPFLHWIIDHAKTETQVALWQKGKKEAEDKVRKAFFEDTKDQNCLDNCMIVSLSWLRELVEKYESKP